MSGSPGNAFEELKALDHESYLLERASAVLGWDQETGLPERAVGERAEQLALLQGLTHERVTDPRIGALLDRIEADGADRDPIDAAFLREKRRQYALATKLPTSLVRELAQNASLGQAAWVEARSSDDFGRFAPHLSRLIELNRAVADHLVEPGDGHAGFGLGHAPAASKTSEGIIHSGLRQDFDLAETH